MSSHIYFKGLKFIRFFAASLVVIHHIEQFKTILGFQKYWPNELVKSLGDKGVTLFFVLSGFLITFLLLKEKDETKTINIKYFYLRRILRIWPLYFLIIFSSLFILPKFSFFVTNGSSIIEDYLIYVLVLSLLIMPNISLIKFGAIPFSSQSWSIGVEEQFYLLWPLLIKYLKKTALILFIIIFLLFILQNCKVFFPKLLGKDVINDSHLAQISFFFKMCRIDCMAFGGIGALMVFYKSQFLNWFFNPIASFLILFFTIIAIINPFRIIFFDNIIYSFLFMAFIINVTTNKRCFYTVENNFFNILGDISYGIYMYHPLVCFTVIKLFYGYLNNIFIYVLVFLFTFILAYLSYILFEKKLIRIKSEKFALIKSN